MVYTSIGAVVCTTLIAIVGAITVTIKASSIKDCNRPSQRK